MRTARSLPYGGSPPDRDPPSGQRPPWTETPWMQIPRTVPFPGMETPLTETKAPLWTDRHLWKHNLRKLRLRAVTTWETKWFQSNEVSKFREQVHRSCCHAGRQDVSRCRTRGESEVFIACNKASGGSKGGARDARPSPWGPKFFQFHAVFWENLAKSYIGAPRGVGAPSLGKSWIRHWKHAKQGIHPGFKSQGRRHQKSRAGVSVAPQKRTDVLQFF